MARSRDRSRSDCPSCPPLWNLHNTPLLPRVTSEILPLDCHPLRRGLCFQKDEQKSTAVANAFAYGEVKARPETPRVGIWLYHYHCYDEAASAEKLAMSYSMEERE